MLFTYVGMPGQMDGLALSAVAHDRWPALKIIVTSGYKQLPDGALFFAKPYDHREVATTIQSSAGQARLFPPITVATPNCLA
jgi:hypothetical protein